MATKNALLGSFAIGLLVLGAGSACAAQDVTPDTAQNEASLSAANDNATPPDGAQAGHGRGHGKHGPKTPDALIERFDENEDGSLQLTELPERKRERMAAADSDEDGTLSVVEIQAHFEARLVEKFAKKDTDGDGFITETEVREGKWETLVKADADADARVSMDEFKAAKAAGILEHGKRHHGKKRHGKKHHKGGKFGGGDPLTWMLDNFDANENDQLELSELPERMQVKLGAADTDSDGVISKDELKAAWTARRAEHFAKKDANGDGAISESEVSERHWKFFSKADADEDGKVTQDELSAAFKSGALKKGRGHRKH